MSAPKYQVMPALSADEYEELKADIRDRGVLVPVEYDEAGEILDGHHRVQICETLGITQWPRVVRLGLSEAGKFTHARQLNLARRHLDREAKRTLIAQQLRETPQVSDRQIAESLGVDHKTVAVQREELEGRGEIPHVETRTDSMGREQPAERERPSAYRYVDPTPAGRDAVIQSATTDFDPRDFARRDAENDRRIEYHRRHLLADIEMETGSLSKAAQRKLFKRLIVDSRRQASICSGEQP